MLELSPDRLGHATHLDPESKDYISSKNIPVEMCMTSNVLSNTVKNYREHHIRDFLITGYKFCICVRNLLLIFLILSPLFLILTFIHIYIYISFDYQTDDKGNVIYYKLHDLKRKKKKKKLFIDVNYLLRTGVFFSDLSTEYAIAASTFSLDPKSLFELSFQSIDCIFDNDETKLQLRKIWNDWYSSSKNSLLTNVND